MSVHFFLRRMATCVWLQVLGIVGLVAFTIIGVRTLGYLQTPELAAYDWTLRFQSKTMPNSAPIVLVTISDQDIHWLGHWPLSDADLTEILHRLLSAQVRTIGIDMYRDMAVPPGREDLEAVLSRNREIVTVMKFGEAAHGGIPGPPVLKDTDQIGFSDLIVDAGGIVRRGLLFLDNETSVGTSFALRLAMRYFEKDGITLQPSPQNSEYFQLGSVTFQPFESTDGSYRTADASGYQFLLNAAAHQPFTKVSLKEALSGKVKPEIFKDRIVMVGVVAQGVKDYFFTAWCGWWTDCHHISGMELQATIVNQLLQAAYEGLAPIQSITDKWENFWILWWTMLGGFVGWWLRKPWLFAVVTSFGCLTICGVAVWAIQAGWWIPLVSPVMGWVLSAGLVTSIMANREKQERQILLDIFGRHVAPEVVDRLWAERSQLLEEGRLRSRKQTVTTMFSDLEGFTGISENLQPSELLDWLNGYMDRMVAIIMRYGGVVDDYHGDMIKADFGSIEPRLTEQECQYDALQAIACAWEMRQEMQRLHQEWIQTKLPTVRIRIGIHTGPVVMGCLGSAKRMKYTTIGDTVNVAARLESFEKETQEEWSTQGVCRILMGETTRQWIHHLWQTEQVGRFRLRGKEQEMTVYRLTGKRPSS
ncbi:MAG: adenylate/guanylate cyclase domain-containing protein [Nitrospirota bacterium]|nr:adenylate/guanylate cyclase domain-containing protein [Nitrospirota bacterium]